MRWTRRATLVAVLLLPMTAIAASAVPPTEWKATPDEAFRQVPQVRDYEPSLERVDVAPAMGSPSPRSAVVPSGKDVREVRLRPTPVVEPSPSPKVVRHRASPTPHVPRVVRDKPPARPKHAASGTPTWYCRPGQSRCTRGYAASGFYAAAGPSLRVGKWRGRTVTVYGNNGRSIRVKLIDFCACGGDHFIDLYYVAWKALGFPTKATVKW